MARADVTIRGAGIFGLSIAWACVQRGAVVRVVDPNGVAAGASGGIVGALAPHVPENWNAKKAFQLDSLLMAQTFWSDVERIGGLSSGYGRTGRVQPVLEARGLELAQERGRNAQDLWQGQADWVVTDAPGAFAPQSPTGWYVKDTLSGRIHPKQACLALAQALSVRGCDVAPQGEDEGAVVWATGWQGLAALSSCFDKPLGQGIKGQAALLDYDAGDAPQVFVDGLHIIGHSDGTVAIGSTTERAFEDGFSVDAQCDALVARAREAMPDLQNAPVIGTWAGLRPRAKSRAPLLGPWPGRNRHFVANGGFKIGFGMAPKVAEVMADLVLNGADHIPAGFRLDELLS